MQKSFIFPAFLGPIVTLLPSLFITMQNEGQGLLFALLIVPCLFLCYLFELKGLIASVVVLTWAYLAFPVNLIWPLGIFISLLSGLFITSYAWGALRKDSDGKEDRSVEKLLTLTRKQLQIETEEKNQFKSALEELRKKTHSDSKVELKQIHTTLVDKTSQLDDLKSELAHAKQRVKQFEQQLAQKAQKSEKKIEDHQRLVELFQKQEKGYLDLIKKLSQGQKPTA